MREIKFRAWDGERLRKVNTIGWVDESVDFVTTPRYSGPAEDFRLMQYTGLKDKNGVEIYEGDIVETTHPFRQRYHLGEVFYDGYQFNVKGFWFPHYDLPNDAFSEGTGYTEVIGNVYENQELLEVES